MPHRDVVFVRVSSEEQAGERHYSVPAQLEGCRDFSQATGGRILAEFTEEQSSWTDELERRPVFREAVQTAIDQKATRFLVFAFDRFARDVYAFHAADRILRRAGVQLVSVTQYHDPESPDGDLTKGFYALMGHAESARISRRVKAALDKKARSGRSIGTRPWGYCRGTCGACIEPNGKDCPHHEGEPLGDGHVMVPHPVNSEGYRLLVRVFLEGEGNYAESARILNAAGYRTAKGKPFDGLAVSDILRNPVYLGMVVRVEGRRRWATLPGLHAALVDRETWERIQRKCRRIRRAGNPWKARHPFPASGVLYCARCGARLNAATPGRSRRRRYVCNCRKRGGGCDLPHFLAEPCEEVLAALLDGLVLPEDWRERARLSAEGQADAALKLAEIEGEERRLTMLFQRGYVDFDEFKRRWDRLQERRDTVTPPDEEAVADLADLLSRPLGELWRSSEDAATQRRVAKAVFKRIFLDGEDCHKVRVVKVELQPEAETILGTIKVD